jgi:hypothetical protein
MAALCARGRAKLSPLHWLSAALLLIAMAAPAAAGPAPNPTDTIVVYLDKSQLIHLPDRTANVVIGNPLIADVSYVRGGDHLIAVITPKGNGATSFIALDHKGVVLMEKTVEVAGPDERTVVVYRGTERETYSCTPECSRRLTLGDHPEFFEKTLAEIVARNSQSAGAGAMSSGH